MVAGFKFSEQHNTTHWIYSKFVHVISTKYFSADTSEVKIQLRWRVFLRSCRFANLKANDYSLHVFISNLLEINLAFAILPTLGLQEAPMGYIGKMSSGKRCLLKKVFGESQEFLCKLLKV